MNEQTLVCVVYLGRKGRRGLGRRLILFAWTDWVWRGRVGKASHDIANEARRSTEETYEFAWVLMSVS